MKKLVLAISLLFTVPAVAGEFRGVVGYAIGGIAAEDNSNDEITADGNQIGVFGRYYVDEDGPFFGLGLSKVEVGDFEFNGTPLGLPDKESDNTTFGLGYRAGKRGDPQLFVAASLSRFDSDRGDDDDSTGLEIGVERTSKMGRYEVSADYDNGDDIDLYGVNAAGVSFLSESVGVRVAGGYSVGDGTIENVEVDVTSWVIGIGVEVRLFH